MLIGFLFLAASPLPAQVLSTFSPDSPPNGSWLDAADWTTSAYPDNGQPAAGDIYDVVVGSGTVLLEGDAEIEALELSGDAKIECPAGSLIRRTLTLNERFTWEAGTIRRELTVNANAGVDISTPGWHYLSTSLHSGTGLNPILNLGADSTWTGGFIGGSTVSGTNITDGRGVINIATGTTFTAASLDGRLTVRVNNAGTFKSMPGAGNTTRADFLNNDGLVQVINGTLDMTPSVPREFRQSSGGFTVSSGSTLELGSHILDATGSITGDGDVVLSGSTPADAVTINGNYAVGGATTLEGDVSFASEASTGVLIIDVSSFGSELNGSIRASGSSSWIDGLLEGSGTIHADGGLDFASSDTMELSESITLNLSGMSTWSGLWSVQVGNTAVLHLLSGASLSCSGDRAIVGSGQFIVEGSVLQSDSGWLSITVPTTNRGLISAVGGGLLGTVGIATEAPGEIRLQGFYHDLGNSTFAGGTLSGEATMLRKVNGSAAILAPGLPGDTTGLLLFEGGLTLSESSTMAIELEGNGTGEIDRIQVGDPLVLAGTLDIRFTGGFENSVSPLDTFTIVTAEGTLSGAFTNAPSGNRLITTDGLGSFIVTYVGGTVVLSEFEVGPGPGTPPLITIELIGTDSVGLSWEPFGDMENYTVETSPSLLPGSWTTIGAAITNGSTSIVVSKPAGPHNSFRVRSP